MSQAEKDAVKLRVAGWRIADAALEEERRRSTGAEETKHFIRMTSGLIAALARKNPPSVTSGFVEQQKFFLRALRSPMIATDRG